MWAPHCGVPHERMASVTVFLGSVPKTHPLLIELIWMHLELSGKTRGINTSTQMADHFFVDLLVFNLIVFQFRGDRRLKGTLGLYIRNEGTKATLSSEVQALHIFYCSAEQYCFIYDGINV